MGWFFVPGVKKFGFLNAGEMAGDARGEMNLRSMG